MRLDLEKNQFSHAFCLTKLGGITTIRDSLSYGLDFVNDSRRGN